MYNTSIEDGLSNEEQVIIFVNKAKSKIAELSTLIVRRGSDKNSLALLLELKRFLVVLASPYFDWDEEDTQAAIDYYNMKADLNSLPYLEMPGYKTYIRGYIMDQAGKTTSVHELVDYVEETNKLISQFPHNRLAGLQGGTYDERYHLDKRMYDYLSDLVYTSVAPAVTLALTSTTPALVNGVAEIGVSITQIQLTPTLTLNQSEGAVKGEYYKDGVLLQTVLVPYVNVPRTFEVNLTEDTVFTYKVYFSDTTPVMSNSVTVNFGQAYYWAVHKRSVSIEPSIMTKVLVNQSTQVDVRFSTTDLNPMEPDPDMFSVALPVIWGDVQHIYVDNNPMFDYITSFTKSTIEYVGVDGITYYYYLYTLTDPTAGIMNTNFLY